MSIVTIRSKPQIVDNIVWHTHKFGQMTKATLSYKGVFYAKNTNRIAAFA